ncbi:MAG: GGDEF domain-containing protein [Gammaproteobacteria bacterium]|nr:GGDEF domain-containing protein [Gammaproteobacteria bacterium]
MRSIRSIEILCLALAALVLVWSSSIGAHPWALVSLLGAFAATIAVFRSRRFLPNRGRARVQIESWAMVAFVSAVLWFTGRADSPLVNLYLLPLILSAFVLGRATAMAQVGASIAVYAGLVVATPGHAQTWLAMGARTVGVMAPILLVAYVTSTLAADVTEARDRIERLAHDDPLTGLLNTRTFEAIWEREHQSRERDHRPYSVLFVDVNQLDRINEEFGREAGDGALTLVARCLQRSIRSSDRASRFGADEFAVLLPGAPPEVAGTIVNRIRHNVFKTTLDVRSRMIRCSVSIGVASYPQDARELRELQSLAEHRMYRDKELRRSPPGAETPA